MNTTQDSRTRETVGTRGSTRHRPWKELLLVIGFGVLVLQTVVGIGIALLVFGQRMETIAIRVRNESGQTVTAITVRVQGEAIAFPELTPGQSALRTVRQRRGDSDFTLGASRADGTRVAVTKGYITSGYFYTMGDFVIEPDSVSFAQREY